MWKDFLFEQEIRASEVVVNRIDHLRASLRDDGDHLPAFKSVIVKRWDIVVISERVVAHERCRGEICHLVTKDLATRLNPFLCRFDMGAVFALTFGLRSGSLSLSIQANRESLLPLRVFLHHRSW